MTIETELTKKLIDEEDEYDNVIDVEKDEDLKTPFVSAAAPRVDPSNRYKSSNSKSSCLRSSCLCKCALITLIISFILGTVMMACTYVWMKDVVEHLTVTTPHAKFPVVDMSDAELNVVKDRVTLFFDELQAAADNDNAHAPTEDLVVSQDEINGFIGHSDYLRGNMFVTLSPGMILEEYSLPTAMLPGGKGRYFVGSDHLTLDEKEGKIEVEMETAAKHHDWFDGPLLFAQLHYLVKNHKESGKSKPMLELYLENGSIFGQEAPQDFINQHKNLLEDMYKEHGDEDCEHVKAILEGIESVSIGAGKIVIKPRRNTGNLRNAKATSP